MSVRAFVTFSASALAVMAGACAPGVGAASPAGAGSETRAVWTPKKVSFTYSGFTTKYSCEGLESQVRSVLLSLGARRDDLMVTGTGCFEPGRPAPFPGVRVQMSVLVPAAGNATDALAAHWKPVDVKLDPDPLSNAGQCELVEQIRQKVLPLFSTRDVQFTPNCVPHQLSPNGTRLHAEVLVPVATEKQANAR